MPKEKLKPKIERESIAKLNLFGDGLIEIETLVDPKRSIISTVRHFVEAFERKSLATGRLHYGTVAMATNGIDKDILFVVPPHARKINFMPGEKSFEYTITFPFTCFSFHVHEGGRIAPYNTSIFMALEIQDIHIGGKLYNFPFGNQSIGVENCHCCWGGAGNHSKYNSEKYIPLLAEMFLSSPYSGHLNESAAENIQIASKEGTAALLAKRKRYLLSSEAKTKILEKYGTL